MSSYNATPNFDNLLLQSLMGRLQIRSPNQNLHSIPSPLLTQKLEEFLFDATAFGDDEAEDEHEDDGSSITNLSKEESKIEKEIVRTILSGNIDILKPNSGQAVTIGDHHVCVGFNDEKDSDYRVWEWHGHVMLFDEEDGYKPEYIYGNYFERVTGKLVAKVEEEDVEEKKKDDEKGENLGLRELIETGDAGHGRILHRNLNAGSPRFT